MNILLVRVSSLRVSDPVEEDFIIQWTGKMLNAVICPTAWGDVNVMCFLRSFHA